jgi:hypothetical protein
MSTTTTTTTDCHEHFGAACEFPTCEQCGGCTEDGGRRTAGRVVCLDCAERLCDAALAAAEADPLPDDGRPSDAENFGPAGAL